MNTSAKAEVNRRGEKNIFRLRRNHDSMKKQFATLLFLLGLVLIRLGFASSFITVYIHGVPFDGNTFVQNGKLYVEAEPFRQALGLAGNQIFPSSIYLVRAGVPYFLISGAAQFLGANFQVNWETGIADFYSSVPLLPGNGPIVVLPESSSKPENNHQTQPASKPCISYPFVYSPYYPYYPYSAFYNPIVLPVSILPPDVYFSNGILPLDSHGHVVFIPGWF